ncbi:MAG: hypothetical protein WKG06_27995 [Segetibacter sp.]
MPEEYFQPVFTITIVTGIVSLNARSSDYNKPANNPDFICCYVTRINTSKGVTSNEQTHLFYSW